MKSRIVVGLFALIILLCGTGEASVDISFPNLTPQIIPFGSSGSYDVNVTNNTGVTWTDFHLTEWIAPGQGGLQSVDYSGEGSANFYVEIFPTYATDHVDFTGLDVISGEVLSFTLAFNFGLFSAGGEGLQFLPTTDGGGDGGTSVPEPTTMLLLGSGLVGLVGYGRRRFKK